jgi:DNA-binding sugar fermentation-stimulating protein
MVKNGKYAGILFVCQRSDVSFFKPMWGRDPKFSNALLNGFNSGLKVWCISTELSENKMIFKQVIPFKLDKN